MTSLLLTAVLGASPQPLELPPQPPRPGQVAFVRLPLARGHDVTSARIEWRGLTLTVVPERDELPLLLPVPLDAPSGIRVTVALTRAGGRSETVSAMVAVAVDGGDQRAAAARWELTGEVAGRANARAASAERDALGAILAPLEWRPREWRGSFADPVRAPVEAGFGVRRPLPSDRPGGEEAPLHRGIDFTVPPATPVLAPAPGRVLDVLDLPLLGTTVLVDHGLGVVSLVGHLRRARVQAGREVTERTVLGESGQSGLAPAPVLHYAVFVAGRPVDPRSFVDLPLWLRGRPARRPVTASGRLGARFAPPPAVTDASSPDDAKATDAAADATTDAADNDARAVAAPSPTLPSPSRAETARPARRSDWAPGQPLLESPPPADARSGAMPGPADATPGAMPGPATVDAADAMPSASGELPAAAFAPAESPVDAPAESLRRRIAARLPGSDVRVELGPESDKHAWRHITVIFHRHGDMRFSLAAQAVIAIVGETVPDAISSRARLTLIDGPSGARVPMLQRDARRFYIERRGRAAAAVP